jgi:hypothetical protein
MSSYKPKFVISTGDNFYSKGVQSVDDVQFKTKFEDTFTAPSLQVPWYVCAGNHDYYGGTKGIEAEMQYTNVSARWNYPSFYFDKVESGNGTSVHIISIDTWRLNGGDTYVKYDPVSGRSALRNATDVEYKYQIGEMEKAKRDVLLENFEEEAEDDPVQVGADLEQLQWIDNTLASSTADWKLVVGHFPVYSCTTGEHGDTPYLVSKLAPMLRKYKNLIYFNGHDHILQHIQKDGVNYFGSGAGAKKHFGINLFYHGRKGSMGNSKGFMYHKIDHNKLLTIFISERGGQPYKTTINRVTEEDN